jgi:hypothetical protein
MGSVILLANKIALASVAIHQAARIIKKANIAKAISQVEGVGQVSQTAFKTVAQTAFQVVIRAALRGAIAGGLTKATQGPGQALLTQLLNNHHTDEKKIKLALITLHVANLFTIYLLTTKIFPPQ